MTLLAIDTFSGMVPKLPAHLLPDGAAQWCKDCDLAHGDLRGLVGAKQTLTLPEGSIGSLYVHGAYYAPKYVYSSSPGVQWIEGPQPADKMPRVYYLSTSSKELMVFLKSEMGPITALQGPAKKAGVPAPPNPPTITLSDKTTWPLGATKLKVTYWYEHLGTKYQVSAPVYQGPVARSFTITVADKTTTEGSATPTEALPVVQVDGVTDKGTVVFSMISDNSAYAVTALEVPGGVNASMTVSGTTGTVTMQFRTSETRAYLFTNVNDLGEESAPSDAASVDLDALSKVSVTPTDPGTFTNYRPWAKYRFYRTAVSTTGVAAFQFLKDTASGSSFADDIETAALGEVLSSDYYSLPPIGGTCVSSAGNGMLAIGLGNTVYFSEPFFAHAWNPLNYCTLPFNIVNLVESPSGLVALTEGNPYLITGVTADAMTPYKLPASQGCLSKLGSVDMGGAVAFVSNDGVVVSSGGTASLDLSQQFWARDDWRPSWASADLRLAFHDGHLYGSYPSSTPTDTLGFALRLDDAAGTLTYTRYRMDAVAYAPQVDGMFFSQGGAVYQMSATPDSTRMPFIWHSKVFVLPKPENLGAMQVVLEADRSGVPPDVKITVYADFGLPTAAKLKTDVWGNPCAAVLEVKGNGYHTLRLPAGFMARHWSFRIDGTAGIVKQLHVATAGVELGNR